ncbi:hypothetical protein [Lysobacter panacisoli]|uniref:hypothetical protein n=1 Tax=Lysobacter panacisoli TaxID=1255263 RepID=UPI00131B73AA|nr:hypothetical protein [Lysobacter panacisoli]
MLLAGCVGSGATTWSPVSCSCTDAWETVSASIGARDVHEPEQLTARVIADAMRDRFAGQPIQASDLPFTASTGCTDGATPDRAVHCTWWIWESGGRKKGYEVLVRTDAKGIFRNVAVTPIDMQE